MCVLQAIVRNLLYLLQEHGHVPNGSRTYYLNRRCMFFVILLMSVCGHAMLLTASCIISQILLLQDAPNRLHSA